MNDRDRVADGFTIKGSRGSRAAELSVAGVSHGKSPIAWIDRINWKTGFGTIHTDDVRGEANRLFARDGLTRLVIAQAKHETNNGETREIMRYCAVRQAKFIEEFIDTTPGHVGRPTIRFQIVGKTSGSIPV